MKIGFYCYSPASINTMRALSFNIPDFINNINIYFYNSDIAKIYFNEFDSLNIDTSKLTFIHNDIDESVKELDLMIYGTGSGHELELTIPKRVKNFNSDLKTLSINDIFWDSKDGLNKRFKCSPDYLIVSSAFEKTMVVNELNLMCAENVFIIGNPHFDRLKDLDILEDRGHLSVSFISQCGLGGSYDEPTADLSKEGILELLELLNSGIITDLVIYKHPRENLTFYNEIGYLPSNTNDFLDMMRSGIIISGGSTPHYESMLIGKRNLFVGRGSLKSRILNNEWDTLDVSINFDSKSETYNLIKNNIVK